MSNHKRSLEDYGFLANLKRRRHLSPQNSNIDLNTSNDSVLSLRKKTRTKSKNSLHESNGHTTPRVRQPTCIFNPRFIFFYLLIRKHHLAIRHHFDN